MAGIKGDTITSQDESFFEAQIAAFKNKAQQFQAAFDGLMTMEKRVASNPALKAEWDGLAKRGFSLRDKIQYVTTKIDAAIDWFKSSFGDYDLTKQNELGFLPMVALIPISIIAGSIALISSFISDVYLFNKKISEAERLISQGIPPTDVARILEASTPQPLLAGISPLVKWVVIGGGIYVLWNMTKNIRG